MIFLFDNDLPPALPRALDVLGELARHIRDVEELGERAADRDWLKFAGTQGWCVVSQDHRILRRHHERAAIAEYDVGAFFVAPSIRGRCDLVQTLVRHWPRMKALARVPPRPFVLEVRQGGIRPMKPPRG